MFKNQFPDATKRLYGFFYFWLFLNAFLLTVSNSFMAIVLLSQGAENNISLGSYVFIGGFIGLSVGVVQWLILKISFSISPLWIISCIVGFIAIFALNWYSGAIIMGLFQQLLIRAKIKDSFLWFIVTFISIGISTLLLFRQENICYYGLAYGLPTGFLLIWYKEKLLAGQQNTLQIESDDHGIES